MAFKSLENKYYIEQLDFIDNDLHAISFKISDNKTSTKWMHLNQESAKALILWIMEKYNYLEK